MNNMLLLLEQAVKKGLLRPIDVQFAKLLNNKFGNPALLLAASYVSFITNNGHVCLPLNDLSEEKLFDGYHRKLAQEIWKVAGKPKNWYEHLIGWSAISDGSVTTPLVFSNQKLYLHRLWDSEGKVVDFFSNYNINNNKYYDILSIRKILKRLFNKKSDNWQKIAIAVSLTRKISIISGGPGTGKTTTIAKLIASIILLNKNRLRIQLVAPTGKAATHMTESFGKILQSLMISDKEFMYFPNKAITLHSLLGMQLDTYRCLYNANNKLHIDVLIIDEASMIDVFMMSKLIVALPDHAHVILIGDRYQLASIESGSVFADICSYSDTKYSIERAKELSFITDSFVRGANSSYESFNIQDNISLLKKSYRFSVKSGIRYLASAVNKGNIYQAKKILYAKFNDIKYQAINDIESYISMIDQIIENYYPFIHLLIHSKTEIEKIISVFNNYQCLCALREGPFGVYGLTQNIERRLIKLNYIVYFENKTWYLGRPIIIMRNDNTLKLFNGDVGITFQDEKGEPKVFFSLSDGSIISVYPSRLPLHETSWAITVHKSQGSEFNHVSLVMPNQYLPILTRELIYTAITRARNKLSLYSNIDIFQQSIKSPTNRYSGLIERLSKNKNIKQP